MKKSFLILSLFFVSLISYSQKKVEWVDVEQIINNTLSLENDQEYEDAIEKVSKIPTSDSSYYSSLTSKTYYYIKTKQWDEAINTSEEGLKSPHKDLHYYFRLHKIAGLLGKKEYDKSLAEIDDALKIYPKNYSLIYNKGLCYEGLDKYEEAADMYKESITYNPFYTKNHLRLAQLCYNEQLITQTMMCLNMYLLCNPDGANSFNILNRFNNMVKSKNESEKHPGVELSKDDKSFEDIDLIIGNYAALNKKYKTGNKINIPLVKQNHAMLGQLENYEGNGGFWDKNYVQFFKWINQNDLFNSLTYTISYSIENNKYKTLVNKKTSQIESFLPRFRAEWMDIVGRNEVKIDNKLTDVQYLYNNSVLQAYGKFENKTTVGKWKIFNDWGQLSAEGPFDDKGEKHGKWTWYNNTGKVSEEGEYNHGELTNKYLVYHDNSKLKKSYTYVDGKLTGEYKEYNVYGALIESVNYKDGFYNGDYISYYELGEGFMEYKIPYENGKIEGTGNQFYPDGTKKSEIRFKDNKKEGTTTLYFRSGKVEVEKEYLDNKLTGKYTEYHMNGNVYQEGNCSEGDYVGAWKTYYDDKVLASEANYEKGKRKGVYNKYDRDGKIHYEYNYRRGNIISYKYYNKDKEVIKEAKKKGGKFLYEGYTPSGNKNIEGEYDVSGGKEGKWTYYSDNGQLSSEQNWKNHNLEGYSKVYHENGDLKSKTPYENDSLQGYYTSYFSNKKMNEQGWYNKNELSGSWLSYYVDGTLKQKNYYSKGKSSGVSEYYNGEGKLATTNHYINDKVKKKVFYNSKGEVKEEIEYDREEKNYTISNKFVTGKLSYSYEYLYNKRHGKYINNYFSGKVYCQGEYFNNQEHGYWKWYHENGKLYKEGMYKHGNREGVWKTYHENGKVNVVKNYFSGYQIGIETTHNELGVKTQTREFNMDDLHGEINFYDEAKGKLQLTRYYNYGTLIGYSYLDKTGKSVPMIPIKNETMKIEAFFDNGNPSRVMELRNGKFVNKYMEYYYSGKVYEDQQYEDNERKGIFKTYYPDGTLKSETNYILGKADGKSKEYHPNGKLKEESNYNVGDKNGANKFYNTNGKLIKEKEYFYGEVFSEKIYN